MHMIRQGVVPDQNPVRLGDLLGLDAQQLDAKFRGINGCRSWVAQAKW
jgi:hypothetical protein